MEKRPATPPQLYNQLQLAFFGLSRFSPSAMDRRVRQGQPGGRHSGRILRFAESDTACVAGYDYDFCLLSPPPLAGAVRHGLRVQGCTFFGPVHPVHPPVCVALPVWPSRGMEEGLGSAACVKWCAIGLGSLDFPPNELHGDCTPECVKWSATGLGLLGFPPNELHADCRLLHTSQKEVYIILQPGWACWGYLPTSYMSVAKQCIQQPRRRHIRCQFHATTAVRFWRCRSTRGALCSGLGGSIPL